MFNSLFKVYQQHILDNDIEKDIFKLYINDMDSTYLKNNSTNRIIIDFISGMTDNFFNEQYKKYCTKKGL